MPHDSRPAPWLLLFALAGAASAACGTARAGSTKAAPVPDTDRALASPAEHSRAPEPLAFVPATTFFVPGERMHWHVTWMGVTGGVASLVVGQPGRIDERDVIIVRSESRSEGLMAAIKRVHDQSSTRLDLGSAMPVLSEGDVEFGERKSQILTRYAAPRVSFQYRRHGGREIRWSQRVPDGSSLHNLHSALGALRAWRPARGDTAAFYGISGRRLYRIELEARGREVIDTPLGRLPTLRIHGSAQRLLRSLANDPRRKPRVFDVWITDDVNRLPVRVSGHTEYGDVEVSLVNYAR